MFALPEKALHQSDQLGVLEWSADRFFGLVGSALGIYFWVRLSLSSEVMGEMLLVGNNWIGLLS